MIAPTPHPVNSHREKKIIPGLTPSGRRLVIGLLTGAFLCGCGSSEKKNALSEKEAPSPILRKKIDKPAAYKGSRPFIAVCYTRKDSDRVYPFVRQLQDAGYRIWYDEGIPLGTNWEDEVAARLAGAEQVLFFLSEATMKSHWTRRELSFSLNKQKEILPLFLESVNMPDGWTFLLGPTQFISLHELTPEQQRSKLGEVLSPKAGKTAPLPHHRHS